MLRESSVVVVDRSRSPASLDSGPAGRKGGLNLTEKQLVRAERRPGHQRRYAPKTRTGCVTCKQVSTFFILSVPFFTGPSRSSVRTRLAWRMPQGEQFCSG